MKIFKYRVPETWHGHALHELLPENSAQAVVITRDGKVIQPGKAIEVKAGDEVYLSASLQDIEKLRMRLESPEGI
jgi:Trk K+ transport system NAD-binding subunit